MAARRWLVLSLEAGVESLMQGIEGGCVSAEGFQNAGFLEMDFLQRLGKERAVFTRGLTHKR